jgi:hypothetical protein
MDWNILALCYFLLFMGWHEIESVYSATANDPIVTTGDDKRMKCLKA